MRRKGNVFRRVVGIGLALTTLSVSQAAVLKSLRLGITEQKTRIVFELDRAEPYQIQPGDTTVTLQFSTLEADSKVLEDIQDNLGGLVSGLSHRKSEGSIEFTLWVPVPFYLRHFDLTQPTRVVIDLYPKELEPLTQERALKSQAPLIASARPTIPSQTEEPKAKEPEPSLTPPTRSDTVNKSKTPVLTATSDSVMERGSEALSRSDKGKTTATPTPPQNHNFSSLVLIVGGALTLAFLLVYLSQRLATRRRQLATSPISTKPGSGHRSEGDLRELLAREAIGQSPLEHEEPLTEAVLPTASAEESSAVIEAPLLEVEPAPIEVSDESERAVSDLLTSEPQVATEKLPLTEPPEPSEKIAETIEEEASTLSQPLDIIELPPPEEGANIISDVEESTEPIPEEIVSANLEEKVEALPPAPELTEQVPEETTLDKVDSVPIETEKLPAPEVTEMHPIELETTVEAEPETLTSVPEEISLPELIEIAAEVLQPEPVLETETASSSTPEAEITLEVACETEKPIPSEEVLSELRFEEGFILWAIRLLDGGRVGHVMVVDDETETTKVLEEYLQREGYEVQGFTESRAALERYSKSRPDLVVLDVVMPELSGVDFANEVRNDNRPQKIIFLSGKSERHGVSTAFPRELDSGLFEFFRKPISLGQIGGRIRDYFSTARSVIRLDFTEADAFTAEVNQLTPHQLAPLHGFVWDRVFDTAAGYIGRSIESYYVTDRMEPAEHYMRKMGCQQRRDYCIASQCIVSNPSCAAGRLRAELEVMRQILQEFRELYIKRLQKNQTTEEPSPTRKRKRKKA